MAKKTKHKHKSNFQHRNSTSGFSVPSTYFEAFEKTVISKLKEDSLLKNSGYNVPVDYFSTLEDTIITKTIGEKNKPKVIGLKTRINAIIAYGAAASILLFIGLHVLNSTANEIPFDDISAIDVEHWFATTNTDVALLYDMENFISSEPPLLDIPDEAIASYLNSYDITALINEIQ